MSGLDASFVDPAWPPSGEHPLVLVLELYRMVQDLAGLAVEHAVQVVDPELDPVQTVVAEVGVVSADGQERPDLDRRAGRDRHAPGRGVAVHRATRG